MEPASSHYLTTSSYFLTHEREQMVLMCYRFSDRQRLGPVGAQRGDAKLHWDWERETGGTSLGVQRLRLLTSTAGGADSIPGQGSKMPHAAQSKKKRERERERERKILTAFMCCVPQKYSMIFSPNKNWQHMKRLVYHYWMELFSEIQVWLKIWKLNQWNLPY